jgi:branched-chain amino acid transport system ATP-binding protein
MPAEPPDGLLEVRDLHAGYGAADVLHGVSLRVARGEFVCVIGANTAGKSTLLRAISRLVPRAHKVPGLGIAHVPEGRHVFGDMSVEENLWLGAFSRRKEAGLRARAESVYALFPRLAERRTQRAGSMSGGEQQMVALGRAMMLEPVLLILDEPSHGLAPIVVEELHRALTGIHRGGTAILLVEQNTALALEVADRGYVLEAGRVVLDGTAEALRGDPQVRTAYLGI